MANNTFYNEILTDHNLHPFHKKPINDPNYMLEGINPSCGDDIVLQLKISDDGIIKDGGYVGDGCAISQASADMMLDLVIGRSKEDALHLCDLFMRMIKDPSSLSDNEMDQLEEASSLQDIAHMPSRVKCAVLGWHTMEEIVTQNKGAAGSSVTLTPLV